jgi:hypothetical protein
MPEALARVLIAKVLFFFEETGGAVQPLLKSFIKKTNSNRADYKELTEFKTKEHSILTLRRLKRQRKKQKKMRTITQKALAIAL